MADRLHACPHHPLLNVGSDVRQALERHLEVGIVMLAKDFKKLIARKDQLGNHRHELIEGVDADADRLVGQAPRCFANRPLGIRAVDGFGTGLGGRPLFAG